MYGQSAILNHQNDPTQTWTRRGHFHFVVCHHMSKTQFFTKNSSRISYGLVVVLYSNKKFLLNVIV